MSPKVSVVIPAFNASRFIEKTLDSVRSQSYSDYEVIVVDDGSEDGTHEVVDLYLDVHGLRGKCLRQTNKKIAGARNTGLRAASGEYIALLDHDDLWYPEKLAAVMEEFARHPEAVLIGHHINVTQDGRFIRLARKGPAAPEMYERLLFVGNAVAPSAAVFRKDKALSIGGFRENPEFNTVEDYDFWMRLSRVGIFRFLDQALAEYPVVPRSASSRVEYHHANLDALLRDHFRDYFRGRPGLCGRLKMRRRLSAVYRSAAGALSAAGAPREKQREFVLKMLREFPFEPKNIARALLWAVAPLQGGREDA